MEKKIRFGELVRNSGRPEVITLWSAPEKNPTLSAAIKQNRVLTVIQEPRKSDFGLIGFHLQPGAAYLVFPRALPAAQNAKVIGINYQLVEQPVFTTTSMAREAGPRSARAKAKPVSREPLTQKFKVKVRRTASLETEVTVEATDKAAAERQAVEEVNRKGFDLSEAIVRAEVVKTQ